MLYVDHGSDFTSKHLEQVSAALRFQVVYSAVGRPQSRGKIERLFGTLNSELLPELPGHLAGGRPATPPGLSLAELDSAIGAFIAGTYHLRPHSEIGETPLDAWRGRGFLPRLPESLEDRPAAGHARPAACRPARRHPLSVPALRQSDFG